MIMLLSTVAFFCIGALSPAKGASLADDKWNDYSGAIRETAKNLGVPVYEDLPVYTEEGESGSGRNRVALPAVGAASTVSGRSENVFNFAESANRRPAGSAFQVPYPVKEPERERRLIEAEDEIREIYNAYKMAVLHRGENSQKAEKLKEKYLQALAARPQFEGRMDAPDYLRESLPAENGEIKLTSAFLKLKRAFHGDIELRPSDLALNFAETDENNLTPLAGRKSFWSALVKDIENAISSINIHIFGMEADDWGWEFARLLARKRAEGVEVKIVADKGGARMTWHNSYSSEPLFEFYRQSGVDFVFYEASFNPFNSEKFLHFDHRKYFIIDGKISYNTGYTLEQHMKKEMFDTAIRAEGPIVNQMQFSFFMNYFANGGKAKEKTFEEFLEKYFPPPALGSMNARLAINVPENQHRVTENYYKKITNAREKVYVVNPYFTDNRIVSSLVRAAENGADVKVVLPLNPENPFNSKNSMYHAWQLHKNGVKVYLYEGPEKYGRLHAKGVYADGFVSMGSCNMDKMALYQNYEQNIESDDAAFAEMAEREVFEYAVKMSRPYEPPEGFFAKLKMLLGGFFTGLFDFIT